MFSFVRDTAFCYVLANLISPSVFRFLCLPLSPSFSAFVFISLIFPFLPFLSSSSVHTYTHRHTHTQVKLCLLWWSLLFGLCLRSPPLCSLLFSVCFVVSCSAAEMQIECRQFALGEECAQHPRCLFNKTHSSIYTWPNVQKLTFLSTYTKFFIRQNLCMALFSAAGCH